MQKKDKEKVFGGDWTEEQLRAFIDVESHDGTEVDYTAVIRAYRHMVPATFQQYINLFVAEGHNLNAKNLDGNSLLTTISSHVQGAEYAEILKAAGAE
ncbi:MAG: PA4642 family protein [Saccharospirillaceae bacterium]|jgi:hypothetical protein|nr:PA4642 family protein [Saccharospirillaceae bacterium]